MAFIDCDRTIQRGPGIESSQSSGGPGKKRLSGERRAWYQVASHLKTPVAELKQRITYTEFLEWLEFILWDQKRVTKRDFYLAQIAAEVRRGWVKSPHSIKMKDFLIGSGDDKPVESNSKGIWMRHLGMKIEEN